MKSKSIAMISYHTCPLAAEEGKETGGMNVYVLELSKELAKRGHQVDIYTRSQEPQDQMIVPINGKVRVIHIIAGPEKNLPKKELLTYITQFTKNLRKFIKEKKLTYDIMHAHYYMSGLIGLRLKQQLRSLPLIMSFHTLALMKNLVARTSHERESSQRLDAEFLLMHKAQKIITPSESDKDYLHYLYDVPLDKMEIIPPGVDTKLFRPINKRASRAHIGANPQHKIVLFVGRIEPLKGIDAILYALRILKTKNPHYKICLWIVGGDISEKKSSWSKQLQFFEKLRQDLRITTSVKFVGQQPQHELPFYYNAADVVAMPSHYESFGMSALEAMACGAPVITTNVSGISTLLDEKHEPLITSVNNPLLLANQIENLLTNKHVRLALSADVFKRIQDLTWENVARRMNHLYDEIS